jgi:histidyl-tRNA synthetase
MKTLIPTVKGTRDFYPEEMAKRNWLYQNLKAISESFGYQEYEAPLLERIDLYAAKSGEELVKEQAFVFPDRGGELLTLRPELTPSFARMVAQRQNELVFPLRWWSYGPFWRYERPQKGRTREFFQWNIDMVGANSPEADAELLAICALFFKKVGLRPDQVKVFVNDRRLMDAELLALGFTPDKKKDLFRALDKRDKMPPADWETYALSLGMTPDQLAGIKTLMSNGDLWKKSPEMLRLFTALEAFGVSDYIAYNPAVIRGLDYYTGTVFEAFDLDGGRAILGGGRYDNLLADVGGQPMGGIGFAMGDVVIGLVLEKYGLVPALDTTTAKVLVTVFDEESMVSSLSLAQDIRSGGISVMCYPEAAKLPKQFKFADRMGFWYVVVEGPDEKAKGEVTVKDLRQRTQETIGRSRVARELKKKLAG